MVLESIMYHQINGYMREIIEQQDLERIIAHNTAWVYVGNMEKKV